jgi:hypothetical protein
MLATRKLNKKCSLGYSTIASSVDRYLLARRISYGKPYYL